ncbi:MAG: tetratricopeptide repeat protein [Alphaproteobacteria bacterium]|nr:tetratricopeptide repeat protein [Alphaproteobacteria bacterium]
MKHLYKFLYYCKKLYLLYFLVHFYCHFSYAASFNNPNLEFRQAQEYNACMTLARRKPEEGFESALAWSKEGGGAPAEHCIAIALIQLNKFPEAALRLEKAATLINKGEESLAAELLGQAAQAWYQADRLDFAYLLQSRALNLDPQNIDLFIDRGVILVESGKYQEALADFNQALTLSPQKIEALVYRGTVYRILDQLDDAKKDINQALLINSHYPEALLERGILKRLSQDNEGARQDWIEVLKLAKDTPTGELAQRNIEKLDINLPSNTEN